MAIIYCKMFFKLIFFYFFVVWANFNIRIKAVFVNFLKVFVVLSFAGLGARELPLRFDDKLLQGLFSQCNDY